MLTINDNSQAFLCACSEIGREYSLPMVKTIEAIVDERGAARVAGTLHLDHRHRALVTIFSANLLRLKRRAPDA